MAGIGDEASWGSAGELTVWTGERGLIVSLMDDPPNGDQKATAIALATAVL